MLSCTIVVDGTDDEIFVGSLNYDIIVDEDDTFILATNKIPCNRTVVAWEFCYQISNDTSATFYPGIWINRPRKGPGSEYELVRSSNVTFAPRSGPCQIFNLADADQFIAPEGSVIGLYSNVGSTAPKLLRTDDMNNVITTFQFNRNQSSARPGKMEEVEYNVAIRVHLGKKLASYIVIIVIILGHN